MLPAPPPAVEPFATGLNIIINDDDNDDDDEDDKDSDNDNDVSGDNGDDDSDDGYNMSESCVIYSFLADTAAYNRSIPAPHHHQRRRQRRRPCR